MSKRQLVMRDRAQLNSASEALETTVTTLTDRFALVPSIQRTR